MHEDDTIMTVSEASLAEMMDRIDRSVVMLQCVWLALQHDPRILTDERMTSIRHLLEDALGNIKDPDTWLFGRAA